MSGLTSCQILVGAHTAQAVFLCAKHCYTFSMVGCAGASKDAPVSY
ncbi:ash family protein [Providencia stuartii]|nr:ash family protein [Providencia stuartii]MBN4876464.1 ash family protein [Providencia stuartii]MBN4878280.1 ash family protein [Providencia stuartii]MBN4881800.1 ash family protein [Providencia stuartii]